MSAIVGSRAADASRSGAATDSAASTPPHPKVSLSSCALRARSEPSWQPSPAAIRIAEGYRNRTCSAVRNAMASATASSSGTDAAQTWSPGVRPRSPRNGSITINHTPTPTATLTIVVSMPLSASFTAVSCPSTIAVATNSPAATRRNGSATEGKVSRAEKYNVDATAVLAASNPRAMARVAQGSVRSGWYVATPNRIAATPIAGAMTRSDSAPGPAGTTR